MHGSENVGKNDLTNIIILSAYNSTCGPIRDVYVDDVKLH